VFALADKLMEETEELCLQREQREVGAMVDAQNGHPSYHFPIHGHCTLALFQA
jgi:hypothetical protein